MENIIMCDNISIHSDNTISTQSNHSCDSCNKSFSRKYNLDRHKTSCKKNKQDTILDLQNEIRILKEQISQYKNDFRQQEKEMIRMEMKIEFMEQTNKELNNSLQQKEMENKELLKMFMEKSTKDISIIAENRMITQQKMISNPNPIITKPKKLTFESFVKEDCLEAYSINEFIDLDDKVNEKILNDNNNIGFLIMNNMRNNNNNTYNAAQATLMLAMSWNVSSHELRESNTTLAPSSTTTRVRPKMRPRAPDAVRIASTCSVACTPRGT